jgi:hypothetical protein
MAGNIEYYRIISRELLAGEPPHTGATARMVIAKRFTEPAPSVRSLVTAAYGCNLWANALSLGARGRVSSSSTVAHRS